MIAVGIDVAKDKHDCFIMSAEGEILFDVFTIRNNRAGFDELLAKIRAASADLREVKVGLEATGHYSYNILGFLLDSGLSTYLLNPLSTSHYRKGISLRNTKTDRVDARAIAGIVLTNSSLKPYSNTLYYKDELKSLTRYRYDRVGERTKLKLSVSRLVTILFPELESLVCTLHIKSVYTLLMELPGAACIAECFRIGSRTYSEAVENDQKYAFDIIHIFLNS